MLNQLDRNHKINSLINYAKNASYDYGNFENKLNYVVGNHDFSINQSIAQV